MTGMTSSTAFWYASRATGVVALVLLTTVVVVGILVNRQGRLPGLPRFAVIGVHRNLSLLSVAFIAVHVLTAVADSYVTIPLAATVVPFASGYERLWVGLGAVSLDLVIAVIATSLLRRYLGRGLWRAVHWLAYVSWPVALVHSIGASTDLRGGVLSDLAAGCVLAAGAAVVWRLAAAGRAVPRAQRVGALMSGRAEPGQNRPGQNRPGQNRLARTGLARADQPGDHRLVKAGPS